MGSGITCQVYSRPDGTGPLVRLADGSTDADPLAPTVLSDLKIDWGRETIIDQPATATCSFRILDREGGPEFLAQVSLGVPIVVMATDPRVSQTVTVFSGRIVALTQGWDSAADAPVIDVTAADFTADLQNTIVGDTPWSRETLTRRFDRIAALAGVDSWTLAPDYVGTGGAWFIAYRDVDAQGALGLLQELAISVAGVLWAESSADGLQTQLTLEDPRDRETAPTVRLSACHVLRDDPTWTQDIQDVTTRISVTWKAQDPEYVGTDHTIESTYTLVDPEREALYGRRGLSVSTELNEEPDVIEVAQTLLARTDAGWRITGLTIDDAVANPDPAETLTNYVTDPSGEYNGITWIGEQPHWRTTSTTYTSHTGDHHYDFYPDESSYPSNVGTYMEVDIPPGAKTATCALWYLSPNMIDSWQFAALGEDGTGYVSSPVAYDGNRQWKRQVATFPLDLINGTKLRFVPLYSARWTLRFDDFSVTFDSDEPAEFSGDTRDTAEWAYSWTGEPGASESIRVSTSGPEDYAASLLTMLDIQRRNGLPVEFIDLPSWPVVGDSMIYLEGGTYSFVDGAWILSLTVSNSGVPPTAPVTLAELALGFPGETLLDMHTFYGDGSTLADIPITPL